MTLIVRFLTAGMPTGIHTVKTVQTIELHTFKGEYCCMAQKPNILFLMSDEHSPHAIGCEGNDIVQTPNLDRLAKSGLTLMQHTVNSDFVHLLACVC